MKQRLWIAFPALFGLAVVLGLIWANGRHDTTLGVAPARAEASGATARTVQGDAPDGRAADGRASANIDPVCGMQVGEQIVAIVGGERWLFCTVRCRESFVAAPERYRGESCLVCRSEDRFVRVENSDIATVWQEHTYRFCTREHRDLFRAAPLDYFMHSMWGLPGWLYYGSVALVLLISFVLLEWRQILPRRGRVAAPASRAFAGAGTSNAPAVPSATRSGRVQLGGAAAAAVRVVRHTDPPVRQILAGTMRQSDSGTAAAQAGARVDLFQWGGLRALLLHPGFRFALRFALVAVFAGIIAAGLFGNQLPNKNIAPLLTWTVWWGGLVWLVLYLGKAWCYVCPWDAIAEWSERLKLWGRRTRGLGLQLAWPRFMRNIWPATVLFVGLTWVELGFGVTLNPRVTAWLGLLILVLAFVSAFVFDRKSFCRYGCLVGRISGLYALFAPVELRARDRNVCRSCRTQSCFRGNEHGDPCPMFEYPATMQQNTYCILCMECVKTCESNNVTLRARPWGADLFARVRPRSDEAYLALIMLSLSAFHGLTMTAAWRDVVNWIGSTLSVGTTWAFSLGMAAMMAAPVLVYAALVGVSRWMSGAQDVGYRDYFVRYAYALLPIALFYHLAHNSEHLLMEGQKVIALASDPFGFEWNLLGTATWLLRPLANLPTLWVLQVVLITIGHVFSLWAARGAAAALFPSGKSALRSQLPMLVAVVLFSIVSLWLLKQPMEMRTSAM